MTSQLRKWSKYILYHGHNVHDIVYTLSAPPIIITIPCTEQMFCTLPQHATLINGNDEFSWIKVMTHEKLRNAVCTCAWRVVPQGRLRNSNCRGWCGSHLPNLGWCRIKTVVFTLSVIYETLLAQALLSLCLVEGQPPCSMSMHFSSLKIIIIIIDLFCHVVIFRVAINFCDRAPHEVGTRNTTVQRLQSGAKWKNTTELTGWCVNTTIQVLVFIFLVWTIIIIRSITL